MSSYTLYKITCRENGKFYVGYTKTTAQERFEQHLLNARWKRQYALADAIRCYGNSAFFVETLLTCDDHTDACKNEMRLIAELNCMLPSGYNMTFGGDGVPLTAEKYAEVAARKKGVSSPKCKAAGLRRRGTKASPETKAKLSQFHKNQLRSETWRKNISAGLKGRKVSAETREKISAARKGKPWTAAQHTARAGNKHGVVNRVDQGSQL